MAERNPNGSVLFVVSGMQGAGKTTVSRLLAGRFDRGVHVEADVLQRMIVTGARWPEDRVMSDEADRQLRLRLHNMCLVGKSFQDAWFTAVLDDIIIGRRVEHLLEELADRPFVFVMLQPSLDVVKERELARGTKLFQEWSWMDEEIRSATTRIGLWIDTSDQSPEETVQEILDRCWADGVVLGRSVS